MATCVVVFGPPGSGKTTLCKQFVEQHSHAVMLSIGEAVRASAKLESRESPSFVAERALDAACKDLPHGHVLVLDGLKRASHVLSSLEVLSRHGMRLKTAIQLTTVRVEASARGRLDDDALPLRLERYEEERSQLLSTLKVASVKVATHRMISEACLADLTSACAMPAQSIDWKACGGMPPQLDLPIQVTNVNQLDWITFPGRYTVGVKADGERAFLVVQNDRLWLSFRSGIEREWEPWATLDMDLSHGTVLDGEFLANSDRFIAFDLLRLPGRSLERDPLDSRLKELVALGLPRAEAVQIHARGSVEEQFSRLHVHNPSPASLTDLHSSSKSPLSVRLTEPLDADSLKRALACDAIPSDGLVFSARELPCGWGKTFKWQPADQIRADLCVRSIHSGRQSDGGYMGCRVQSGVQLSRQLSFSSISAPNDQPTTTITFPNLPPSVHMTASRRIRIYALALYSLLPPLVYLCSSLSEQVARFAAAALPLAARLTKSSSTDIASIDIEWESLAEACACNVKNRSRSISAQRKEKTELAIFLGMDWQVQPQILLKCLGEGLLGGLLVMLVEVGAEADDQLATQLAALFSNKESTPQIRSELSAPIFACRWVTPEASAADGKFSASVSFKTVDRCDSASGWMPAARRYDKSHANAPSTIEAGKVAAANPALNTKSALQASMLHSFSARSKDVMETADSTCSQPAHAALQIPFADFRQLLDEAAGSIERTRIGGTELVVLNARGPAPEASSNILAMCRGLVISESTVVAAPFCKFGSAAKSIGPCQLVEATEKIDGSHIIAFMWQGEIITCTKRRADSEQALWSKAYLQCKDVTLTPGFTYMFEAVYRDNAVVVKYQQDECILIAVRDDSGIELDRVALLSEGRRIQLPVVVMMKGTCAEFLQDAEDASNLNSEGWVLKSFGDGGKLRGKVIRKAWSSASRASVDHVSPLAAAHAFGTRGARRASLSLAAHHQLELEVMREALLCYWLRLRRRLVGLLGMQSSEFIEAYTTANRLLAANRLLGMRTEASLDSPWVECMLSRTAAALRGVPEIKQIVERLNTDSLNEQLNEILQPFIDPAFNYLEPQAEDVSRPCIAWNAAWYMLAMNVLCLLVRARCIAGAIPGYRASICAKSTLAKSWTRRTPVESSSINPSTSSLSSLPLELLEPILAHLDGRNNISLVCRGLYQVVYASAEVAEHAVERATCQLEQTADRPREDHEGEDESSYGYDSGWSSEGYDRGFSSGFGHSGYGSN